MNISIVSIIFLNVQKASINTGVLIFVWQLRNRFIILSIKHIVNNIFHLCSLLILCLWSNVVNHRSVEEKGVAILICVCNGGLVDV